MSKSLPCTQVTSRHPLVLLAPGFRQIEGHFCFPLANRRDTWVQPVASQYNLYKAHALSPATLTFELQLCLCLSQINSKGQGIKDGHVWAILGKQTEKSSSFHMIPCSCFHRGAPTKVKLGFCLCQLEVYSPSPIHWDISRC